MKKVSLLILVSLVLLLVFASCAYLPDPVKQMVCKHEWTEATCEAPKTCEACGKTEGEVAGHNWTAATCEAPKTCSVCQATEGKALGHDYAKATCTDPETCKNCGKTNGKAFGHDWEDPTCTEPKTCEVCQATEGEALGHTNAAPVKENVTAPGCETDGKYDLVIYCSACQVEVSREKDVVDSATGHTAGKVEQQNKVDASCTVDGSYDEVTFCATCNGEMSRVKKTITAPGHTAGKPVVENDENAPTCTTGGSYDEVIYCTVDTCKAELDRKTITQEALGHKPGEMVKENENAPTCTVDGSHDEVTYCTVCGTETSREPITDVAPGHTAGEAVVENDNKPTCEADGTYDEVVYCTVCNHEMSREPKTVDALGHDMAPATCDAPSTCKNGCGKIEGVAIANHTPTATIADGKITYKCATCEDKFTTDQALVYDGSNKFFESKGDGSVITYDNSTGEYTVTAGDRTDGKVDSQYLIYGPSNDKNATGMMTGWNDDNDSFGVFAFKIKPGTITQELRVIVMSARNNPNWDKNKFEGDADGWRTNSIDVIAFRPNDDGTYKVYGNNITSNTFATVNGDEWVDVKMFMQIKDGIFTISYYINGEFCNVYERDFVTQPEGSGTQLIRNLDINNFYICGYTAPGTGFALDDMYFGYAKNTEWLFDEHEHAWKDADCENAKMCTACGITEGEALGHEEATRNENVVAPDCVNTGKHDEVTFCSVCNKELGRETVTDVALGHIEETVTGTPATCTEGGMTDGKICTREGCKTPTLKAQAPTQATGHKDEDSDNICDVCTTDLTCNHEGTERTPVAGTPATCTATGLTDGEKCAKCGEFTTPQEEIKALGHKPGEVQKINVTAPTCTEAGKHDEQVWCTVCNELVSETKDVVDPATGHTEVKHAGQAATCTEKGWKDYVTCENCDYTTYEEIAAKGHSYSAPSCAAPETCSVCGAIKGAANTNAHTLSHTYASGKLFYACQKCDYKFDVDTFDYLDGSNYNGVHCNAPNNTTYYTTNPSNANYPVQTDGYYEFVRKTDAAEGVANTTSAQLQMWMPTANGGTNKFSGFSSASNSIGYLAFKINGKTDNNLEFKLVDNRVDAIDVDGDGDAENVDGNPDKIRWGDLWAINDPVFRILPAENGVAKVLGFNSALLTTCTVDENGYSGWVDVAIQLVLDPDTDKVIAHYYINGQYVTTQSRPLSTHTNAIQAVYINSNNTAAGCGYKIDNLTFGYTAHKHDMAPVQKNGNIVYNCADCGTTFSVADEYVNYDGSNKDFYYVSNGTFPLTNEGGEYSVIFNPATETSDKTLEDFKAAGVDSSGNPNKPIDGWFWNSNSKKPGGQHMFWIPSNGAGKGLAEFSCANNSVGVVSFRMKTNVTEAFTLSVAKERGASDWGNWGNSELQLLRIGGYNANGIELTKIFNGTSTIATIPVADGWSEWFDVMMVIQLKDDNTVSVYYYINGAFVGSGSAAMNINSYDIRAIYINGWTHTYNTGIMLDDIVFGSTKNGHNTLDGQYHVLPEGANCKEETTCSCGWTGIAVAHDYTEATCAAPATCKGCGATKGDVLTHTITAGYVDGKATYGCSACDAQFAINNGYYADGSANNYDGLSGSTANSSTEFTTNNGQPIITEGGYYEYTKKTEDAGAKQLQIWLPIDGKNKLTTFNAGSNAVGVLSFSINSYVTGSASTMQFANSPNGDFMDKNGDGILQDWDYIQKNNMDYDGNGKIEWADRSKSPDYIRWTDDWRIGDHFFKINALSNNVVTVQGWGAGSGWLTLKTVNVTEADPWTGWYDVAIVISFDAEADTIICAYFIDGEYIGTGYRALTTQENGINSIYWNTNTAALGSGYKFDNMAFGYTENGHNIFDGQYHKVTETTCGEKSTCVCGWTGYTVAHTFAADCQTNCSVCGAVNPNAAVHPNLTPAVVDGAVTYTCATCNHYYALDDSCYSDGENKNHSTINTATNGVHEYIKTPESTTTRYEFWSPRSVEITQPTTGFVNFSAANNAVGVLSFDISAYHNNRMQMQLVEKLTSGTTGGNWDPANALAATIFSISKPNDQGNGTFSVTAYGLNGTALKTYTVTAENMFTAMTNFTLRIYFSGDDIVIDYYVDGVYKTTLRTACTLTNKTVRALHTICDTTVEGVNSGYYLDNFYFGYTTNGMKEVENVAPEAPFYKEVIAKENVQSETLKTIVDSKIKQCDQATLVEGEPDASNGYFTKEGGTAVYVIAEGKDGEDVEALYFSRSIAWHETASQNTGFTEFRFATDKSKKMLGFSFDYLVKGTTEERDEDGADFDGTVVHLGHSYVQVKDSTGDYVEMKNSALTTDGEWHTMTIDLGAGQNVENILVKLQKFMGEMLIANLVVTYESPLYNADGTLKVEVIGTRKQSAENVVIPEEDNTQNVTDAALLSIVDFKIKQFDQTDLAGTQSGIDDKGYFEKECGTSTFVKVWKDTEYVEAVYLSRTKDWDTHGTNQNEYKTEHRYLLDKTKKVTSISFDYLINGSINPNRSTTAGVTGQMSIFQIKYANAADNTYNPSDAYFDEWTDMVGEDDGVMFITDGQWHSFTFEFETAKQLTNFLIIMCEFQGEFLLSNLVVTYA